ncbi:MAG: hypothetical protein R2751_10850 [Bacteroidales bacterium]
MNLNFPHLFQAFDPSTGLYPGSTPEARGILEYAYAHPEIALAVSLDETNFCLEPPRGGRRGDADLSQIRIPNNYVEMLQAERGQTYTLEEVIEMTRKVVPASVEVDADMVAGFLGLGAAVNPLKPDLEFYDALSKKYKAYLEEKEAGGDRLPPADAADGSFELWAYYHLGVPVFSLDLFGIPSEEKKPGEEKSETPAADAAQLARLHYADSLLGSRGFVDWTPYKHPELGDVEIGGFPPYLETPPHETVKGILDVQIPWILELAEQLPSLALAETRITPRGSEVYLLEVWVRNEAFLPFPTAMGKRNRQPAPAIILLEGKGIEFLEGRARTPVPSVEGHSTVKQSWLIRAGQKTELNIRLECPAAGNDQTTAKLGI